MTGTPFHPSRGAGGTSRVSPRGVTPAGCSCREGPRDGSSSAALTSRLAEIGDSCHGEQVTLPAVSPIPEPKQRPKRLGHGWTAPVEQPGHVRQCQDAAGKHSRLWWIYTWRYCAPEDRIRIPYTCHSWRCEACAVGEAAVLFARLKETTEPLDPRGFVFMVLTLDQKGYYDKREHGWRKFRDLREAYRELGKQSQSFLYRLRAWQKRNGMTPVKSQWFATVESHRSGWPHMNLVLYSPELAEHLDHEQKEMAGIGFDGRALMLLRGELLAMAMAAGWGRESTAERVRDREAMAGYVTKSAGFADRTAGEVAKVTQLPLSAPPRFRRLRSGKGFLVERKQGNPNWTGTLIRRQPGYGFERNVLTLHKLPKECTPEYAKTVQEVCNTEVGIWESELQKFDQKRSELARHGPQALLGPRIQYYRKDVRIEADSDVGFNIPPTMPLDHGDPQCHPP